MNKRNISNKKPCPHCNEPLHYLRKTCSECKKPTNFKEVTNEKRNGKLRESFEKGLKASLHSNSLMRIKQSISKQMAKLEGVGYASVLLIIGRKPSYRSSFITYNETIEQIFVEEKSCSRRDLSLRGHHILTFLKDEYISAVDKEDSQSLPDSAESMEAVEVSADEDQTADNEDVDEVPIDVTHGKDLCTPTSGTKREKEKRTQARKAKDLKTCPKKGAKKTKTAEEQSNQKTCQLPISPVIRSVKGSQELEPEPDVMVVFPDIQWMKDQLEHTVDPLIEENVSAPPKDLVSVPSFVPGARERKSKETLVVKKRQKGVAKTEIAEEQVKQVKVTKTSGTESLPIEGKIDAANRKPKKLIKQVVSPSTGEILGNVTKTHTEDVVETEFETGRLLSASIVMNQL